MKQSGNRQAWNSGETRSHDPGGRLTECRARRGMCRKGCSCGLESEDSCAGASKLQIVTETVYGDSVTAPESGINTSTPWHAKVAIYPPLSAAIAESRNRLPISTGDKNLNGESSPQKRTWAHFEVRIFTGIFFRNGIVQNKKTGPEPWGFRACFDHMVRFGHSRGLTA